MLPLFLMLRSLGLVNTYVGAILPGTAGIFGIFLIRQFALAIPDDLLDAARLDGASEFLIYRRIVLPLLKPVLATLGIVTFLGDLERLRVAARRPDRRVALHAAGGAREPRRRARARTRS